MEILPLRFMFAVVLALSLQSSVFAQCSAPELVKGADGYNKLVCEAVVAMTNKDDPKALEILLTASNQPVLESPNIRLFGQIAETYARLGRFHEADLYLKYDDLSILWMIGIVRCEVSSNSGDEQLVQDGKPLTSEDAKHMSAVLCGPVFDDFSYFQDRDTESFVPAAQAILRYATFRKEIEAMRSKQRSNRR